MARSQTQNGENRRGRTTTGIYKLRTAGNSENGRVTMYQISVPREIGERLEGRLFKVRVTEEGILYTPVAEEAEIGFTNDLEAVSWA